MLVHERAVAGRQADFGVLRPRLPASLARALVASGVGQLYGHQVAAIQRVRAGDNVVVTSPTASGKSLCFALPTIERLLSTPGRHALYLYPSKALIADQLRGFRQLLEALPANDGPPVVALTGDTSYEERQALVDRPPAILLATPDILHHALLPGHRRWHTFLSGLDVVVLDELHAYRGVFGAHVALVVRRLRRLAAVHGSHPTFITASATIGNAVELAEELVGLPFALVDGDTSGTGQRRFLFWRPPLRGSLEANEHASVLQEAAAIFAELLQAGRRGILFGRSRQSVERMLLDVRRLVRPELAERVSAYKSGYRAEERSRIEAGLREGRLVGVVATNALELGIDMGVLDVAVLAGYPGSVMSFWQQAGRVGRRAEHEALVVLVGSDDALDQYVLEHPDTFFGQPMEQAVVDPDNPSILLGHLLCAAYESPLVAKDLSLFPARAPRLVERLVGGGYLTAEEPWRAVQRDAPHRDATIRGVAREPYAIVGPAGPLASIEPPQLQRECHPGAVYLHNGRAYRVTTIEAATRIVHVVSERADVRTDPLGEVEVAPRGDPLDVRDVQVGERRLRCGVGPLRARGTITGYREHRRGSGAVQVPLAEPLESVLDTIGLWLDVPAEMEPDRSALHTAEHALVNALPLTLLCDRRDVGSTSEPPGASRVYLFDLCDGGIGLAEKAFRLLERLLADAAAMLDQCPCAEGCPNCVHLAGCEQANAHLDKVGGAALLLGRSVGGERAVRRLLRASPREPGVPEDADQRRRQLRRIAEDDLRERFAHDGPGIEPGTMLEWVGHGLVLVRDVGPRGVEILPLRGGLLRWVPPAELRQPRSGHEPMRAE